MQTNANREEKNIVERWDWNDMGYTDNSSIKRYGRRLRRRKVKVKFQKEIKELI